MRGCNLYFGGLTVILSGDFYQLPPIRNELYGDFGHHSFTLKWFSDVFAHRIYLHLIHRQTDNALITAVNELERGVLSAQSIAFVYSLSCPLTQDMMENSVYLFARNLDVDLFNYEKVQGIKGQLYVFTSEDMGDTHFLNKFLAPKNLGLKQNCPVMLLTNISDQLVNGKIGKVSNIAGDDILVEFLVNETTKTKNF